MKTIFKYGVQIISGPQEISMRVGAEILCAQSQNGEVFIWALVDPHKTTNMENRIIEVFGTGHSIHEDMGVERKYISTVQQPPFVWHIFERIK